MCAGWMRSSTRLGIEYLRVEGPLLMDTKDKPYADTMLRGNREAVANGDDMRSSAGATIRCVGGVRGGERHWSPS